MEKYFGRAVLAAVFITTVAILPANAGSENSVYLLQETSPTGGLGNTLTVNQSSASNSLVAGNTSRTRPAIQRGTSNSGTITVAKKNANVIFLQGNLNPTSSWNSATVNITGADALALLQQNGLNNTGLIEVSGRWASGSLIQIGEGNNGTVTVSGESSSGLLVQDGDKNVYSLNVSGGDVSYTIIGSGVTSSTSPQVYSNGGTVTITQTVLSGI